MKKNFALAEVYRLLEPGPVVLLTAWMSSSMLKPISESPHLLNCKRHFPPASAGAKRCFQAYSRLELIPQVLGDRVVIGQQNSNFLWPFKFDFRGRHQPICYPFQVVSPP